MSIKEQNIPFIIYRKQFPVNLSYTMMINRSQGQNLTLVVLYLPRLVFTHGQLYVALSRVTSRNGLKILIENDQEYLANETKNVVYKEVLKKFK